MNLAEFGKRHGVSKMAVSKAIARGRLSASISRDEKNRPSISDPELGDREWESARRGPPNPGAPTSSPPSDDIGDRDVKPANVPGLATSVAIKEAAAARVQSARAEMAELDAAKRRGELIGMEKARNDVKDAYTLVKTRLLGVPSRLAQRFPQDAARIVPVLDKLIREALEELANGT